MKTSNHVSIFVLALTSVACEVKLEATTALQSKVNDLAEHCSVSVDAAEAFDYEIIPNGPKGTEYRQLMLMLAPNKPALCTVTEVRDEVDPESVRMEPGGFAGRFGALVALPTAHVPISGDILTHACGAEIPSSEPAFVECLEDDGQNTNIVVAAPHGGNIEPRTDEQADVAYAVLQSIGAGVSSWYCKGQHPGEGNARKHWHITSTDISARSFPALKKISTRNFAHAISFHGMLDDFGGQKKIIVGGRASPEKRGAIVTALNEALNDPNNPPEVDIVLAMEGDKKAGREQDNFVNWLTATGDDGIQIEQSWTVRQDHWHEIATVVATTVATF